jgi:hypothetical protein
LVFIAYVYGIISPQKQNGSSTGGGLEPLALN